MSYTTRDLVEAAIPAQFLERGLWREGEEEEGVFDRLVSVVSTEIDGYLSGRYPVPFSAPIPGAVANAAFVLTCDLVFRRNGVVAESNPWASSARMVRDYLRDIQAGKVSIAELPTSVPAASFSAAADLRYDTSAT